MNKHKVLLGVLVGAGAVLGVNYLLKKTNALNAVKQNYEDLMKELNRLGEEMANTEDMGESVDYADDELDGCKEVHHAPSYIRFGKVVKTDLDDASNLHKYTAEMHKNFDNFVKEHSVTKDKAEDTLNKDTEENETKTEQEIGRAHV